MSNLPATTVPCPWVVGPSQTEARPCGEAATSLLVDLSTGEVDVACPAHEHILDGYVAEFGAQHYAAVKPQGRLHNTSIAFSL